MMLQRSLATLSDDELLRRLADLVQQSRRVEADLVAHIAEVDARRLYARLAFPSMFAYCTEALHLSEAEAYLRIAAARASGIHPILLTMLGDGRLHLTAIAKLAPHLTMENRDTLLKRAAHRTRHQIEELLAEISPRPDVPAVMRKLPERSTRSAPVPPACPDREPRPGRELRPDAVAAPAPGPMPLAPGQSRPFTVVPSLPPPILQPVPSTVVSPLPPTVVPSPPPLAIQPLAPGRYKVQFTASGEFKGKLERLQALMGSQGADRDLAAILEQVVTEKLERMEARRFATTKAPRKDLSETDVSPSSRHVPAAVRRAVRARDGHRCRYVDEQGRRCSERRRLEFHHLHPYGFGGDHSLQNVCLMCRAHNRHLAELDYGRETMVRRRRSRSRASEPAAASSTPVP